MLKVNEIKQLEEATKIISKVQFEMNSTYDLDVFYKLAEIIKELKKITEL